MDAGVAGVEGRSTHFWRGVWRVADPKITLASAASLLLGAALAFADGPLHWGWLAVTVLGIFCVEAAKNASGELFDWDSGADQAVAEEDRSPFSGGKRVLVDGLWTRRETVGVAAFFYGVAIVCGLTVVFAREPRVLWLGMAGVGLAFFYHAPPLKLSYRGLGELAVGFVYGPLISAGTYLVQRRELPARLWLFGLPLGLLIAAFLWINEYPDRRADAQAGKRTWVVRLGPERAAWGFTVVVSLAYVLLALLPLAGASPALLGGFVGAPFAAAASRRLLGPDRSTRALIPAQGWTLLSFCLASVGAAVGLVVAAVLR